MKAVLALEDGEIFYGKSFGHSGEACGEVVFNTSLTGYQEIMTDPSYKGQMICMTYPLIGNYGVNSKDVESEEPQLEALIIRELSTSVSNWRAESSLADYMKTFGVVGIEGIDTRRLTKHLRDHGAKQGIISTEDLDLDSKRLVARARALPSMEGQDIVKDVSCKAPYDFTDVLESGFEWPAGTSFQGARRHKIVCIDSGIKRNILRKLNQRGFDLKVVPATMTAKEILDMKPEGVFLSNGPGDPAAVTYLVENVRSLIGKVPMFGICLGHQILGLALGGKTFKLKFGHRGGNHPVMDLSTRIVEITSQNHGFCVDIKSLNQDDIETTHVNLNDKTLEGFRHRKHPLFAVQYHPEASPGPHDADYLFGRFYKMVDEGVW